MGTLTEKNLEVVEFLKHQSIFQVLEHNVLESLSMLFVEIVCGPGHIIFSEGDPSDGLYVVKTGNVAVLKGHAPSKVIAFLTAGECFGEMAEVQDSVRSATIRVPEEAVVLRLPTNALKEVTRKFPAVSSKIADIISRRSASGTTFKPPGLQGNLAFFDLPTVIQTVMASRQDGVLSLFGRSGKVVGRLVLANTGILSATFDQLRGEYALYELMNSSDPLDFTFDQSDIEIYEVDKNLKSRPPHMLLIEGARRADELPKLLKSTGWPTSIYTQVKAVPDIAAFGVERRDLTRTLWNLIEMGCNTESICKQTNCDRYSVLTVLNEIINAEWIRRTDGPTPTEELRRRTGQFRKPTLQDINDYAARQQAQERASERNTGSVDGPTELVKMVNAFNGVATNLGLLYGKVEVRMLLQEALAKASQTFPALKGLRVHIDTPCLDLRGASAEFSRSPDSVPGLLFLGNNLMELVLKMQKS